MLETQGIGDSVVALTGVDFEFDIVVPGEGEIPPVETWGGLYYRKKDCLIPDVAKLREKDSWKE